jgi:hypothetical protein
MKNNIKSSIGFFALSVLHTLAVASTDHSEGKELHDETCVACHISVHDEAFYTSDTRVVKNLFELKSQTSRCSQFFQTGWFPEEEQAVLDYLNHEFYKFEHK